mmetsp:Transcript_1141/g.703  ORF Transcript_1141/g.703 Transcript_1141/m.703 type:complete len:347 (+) Transcript_1141:36-1076(+)|eukprot:CAMPEP_0202963644 /NCGR_PEP_ID=MMETSP1396-20130829/7663_1 /ASSEMBLY_ACC=CAM_ASM_000872 /TAXON_ID= /ORGANISM="Pseudokeronopsis sp., Strain Brazil" /LENGTH=346 /DNA_ID=CAMNT_0049685043 /DNA_START=25 /DNA_END=1065 /DNA_ORIENTATION=-
MTEFTWSWNPTLLDRDHESVTIAWEPNPAAITYEIQMLERSEESEVEWIVLSSSFKNHFLRKKNLREGVGYQFKIRCQDSAGEWSKFTLPSDAYYVLNAEVSVMNPPTFMSHDGSSITIQWEPVEGAEGYHLRWRKEENLQWTTVESVIRSTNAKKNGLGSGRYYFSVMPLLNNDSAWSYSSPGGPFKVAELNSSMARYFPGHLLSKAKGSSPVSVPTSNLLAGKITLVYFSAHWCGPCRNFTPQLANFYTNIIQANAHFKSQIEVVFCSADHSEEDFKGYYRDMPWLAIDYEEEAREQLMGMFQVNGIPRLIVFGTNGQVLQANAVGTPLSAQTAEAWIAQNKGK